MKRSTLQRKDREELTSIARALGGSPSSRARKADLVDLILDLAEGPGTSDGGGNGDGEPATDEAQAPPAAVEEQPSGDSDSDRSETDDVAPHDSDDDSTSGGSEEAPTDEGRRQPEPGNRRRRRRGRDRERGADEAWSGDTTPVDGFLDLRDEGYGFLRVDGFMPSKDDAYVSVKQVRQFGLRRGDQIIGGARPANRNEKNAALHQIDSVNGQEPDSILDRPEFEDLTAVFPDERLSMEIAADPTNLIARTVDLIAPIGKGQRGLIAAPPGTGKTAVIEQLARSIEVNHPEVQLIVLLVDERPEEITGFERLLERGEVASSTFDRPADEHVAAAELTLERAKRIVESGRDVCVLVDGLTRLTRAYNLAAPANGRAGNGGLAGSTIHPPKRFFGAARNVEGGGSLTVLATVAVNSDSSLDQAIYEEFRGAANMELRLDRNAADQRLHPAVDILASSTSHDELLFDDAEAEQVARLRRALAAGLDDAGAEDSPLRRLIELLTSSKNNAEALKKAAK